jgi:hypothetical protein
MNRWRVGEDRGSKETDRCPLTHLCTATMGNPWPVPPPSAPGPLNQRATLQPRPTAPLRRRPPPEPPPGVRLGR